MNAFKKEKPFIIYGLGERGKIYYDFFADRGFDGCVAGFCDQRYLEMQPYRGKPCYSYDAAKALGVPFLLSVLDRDSFSQIAQQLTADGCCYYGMEDIADYLGVDKVAFNRAYIAFFHDGRMDNYYSSAEEKRNLDIFWGEHSDFLHLFRQLDLTEVIELACGRGRHVGQYLDSAGSVTLVDILEKNIAACQERFRAYRNVHYYCNNGFDLKQLESGKYTALFSYDAMVHFEMMDIYQYLKDIYRVCAKGGRVLIHHSNYAQDYKASFLNSPHGRSYMTDGIFAYLAFRSGFKVLEQKVISWGESRDIDCITLLEK